MDRGIFEYLENVSGRWEPVYLKKILDRPLRHVACRKSIPESAIMDLFPKTMNFYSRISIIRATDALWASVAHPICATEVLYAYYVKKRRATDVLCMCYIRATRSVARATENSIAHP